MRKIVFSLVATLGLSAVAVQRENELGPATLAKGLRSNQSLAGADRLMVATQGQPRGDSILGRRLAQLVLVGVSYSGYANTEL